jgi:hypothetical protein
MPGIPCIAALHKADSNKKITNDGKIRKFCRQGRCAR